MFFTSRLKNIFKKKKYILNIEKSEDIFRLKHAFEKEKIFCLDTEFDWRSTYFPRLSLIQLGFKNEIYLLDCLKIDPKNVLKEPLESLDYFKIFHSARSDATVLNSCLEIRAKNIFDIQIAEKKIGSGDTESYAKLVSKYMRKNLDKNETNSNWLKRPLDLNQLNYAAKDVEYLIDIFYMQKKILNKRGLLKTVLEDSENEAKLGNQDMKIARLKRVNKKLTYRQKKMFLWREDTARLENIPPSFLFKDKYLRKLSTLREDEINLKSEIMKIIGDTKWVENFISNFF